MTPDQMSIIYDSFNRARSMNVNFASRFYHHLFSDYPEMRSLFGDQDMEAQHARFVEMLDAILISMSHQRSTTDILTGLGKRHYAYGVKDDYYEKFGAALLKVLQELLGSEFNESLRDTWGVAYREITQSMKSPADGT